MEVLFSLKHVTYKDIININTLDIAKGEVTCLLGESGSGKTTLLKLLNNLISPDKGEIYLEKKNIMELDPVELRRRVIMLGQSPVVFPGSIKENLNLALTFSEKEILGEDDIRRYLKMVHLEKDLGHNAEKLSGGEKQRLALARVLILNPEVLLLDEPSSALDAETEDLVIETLVDYVKNHEKSLIMVTHSKEIAKKYGETIIKINKGHILNSGGSPNE